MADDCQLYISVVTDRIGKIQELEKKELLEALEQFGDSRWPADLIELSGYTKAGVRLWRLKPERTSKQLEDCAKQLLTRYIEKIL